MSLTRNYAPPAMAAQARNGAIPLRRDTSSLGTVWDLTAPGLPGAEPQSSAVRSKRRRVRRKVGGARSGAHSARDAGRRVAEAARGARLSAWEQISGGSFTPADTAAGRTFAREQAIHIPIAATARNSPRPMGTIPAIVPAGRENPARRAWRIWTPIACKRGSKTSHVRIANLIHYPITTHLAAPERRAEQKPASRVSNRSQPDAGKGVVTCLIGQQPSAAAGCP